MEHGTRYCKSVQVHNSNYYLIHYYILRYSYPINWCGMSFIFGMHQKFMTLLSSVEYAGFTFILGLHSRHMIK